MIKASATDIPVFYLNLTLKNDSAYGKVDERAFLDLCEFAENVIKRRIEQLAEVAMVDVTGLVERQLQIVPDPDKLAVLGLSIEDIENVLAQNNVEPGSMTVRDGYYEYNIKFSTLLRTEEDVKGILLRKEGRIIRLGDFCRVEIVPAKEKGVSMSNGKRAVTLAVIKQADENMEDMKLAINSTMDYFKKYIPTLILASAVTRRSCWTIPSPIFSKICRWVPVHLHCGGTLLGGCQVAVHHRPEHGGVHCNLFLVLLSVQDVAQYHFSVRIDSGVGYDD